MVEYDYETATAAFDRSFALSSSSALALGFSSIVRAWKGDDAMAVDQAERAIRLSPFDPLLYVPYVGLAYAHFAAGRFEEAATAASRASQSNPRFSMPDVLHAAALANLGRREEARVATDRLRQVEPNLTVSTAIRSARFANPDKNTELGDALLRAACLTSAATCAARIAWRGQQTGSKRPMSLRSTMPRATSPHAREAA